MKKPLLLATLALIHGTAQAAITVTNLGTTTPTGFTTGNTALDPHITLAGSPEVFGFRNTNTLGQTFTVASAITLEKIFIGYGSLIASAAKDKATSTTITLTVDEGNNVSNEISESFTLTTASITQDPTSPYAGIHWLELDVSSSNLALAAGIHSFKLTVTATAGGTDAALRWLLAPSYTGTAGYVGDYTGGNLSGTAFAAGFPNRDANFAISGTAVPEPGSLALLGLGVLPLMRRRRA